MGNLTLWFGDRREQSCWVWQDQGTRGAHCHTIWATVPILKYREKSLLRTPEIKISVIGFQVTSDSRGWLESCVSCMGKRQPCHSDICNYRVL